MPKHIIKRNRDFVDMAESKVSTEVPKLDDDIGGRSKKVIAENVLKIAKYARRMGIRISPDEIPFITITNDPECFANDKSLGTYIIGEGQVYIRGMCWDDDSVMAHEIFHSRQDKSGNRYYFTHLQQSYLEGGADFFRYAYLSRNSSRLEGSRYLFMWLGGVGQEMVMKSIVGYLERAGSSAKAHTDERDFSRNAVKDEFRRFKRMRREERYEYMNDMLGGRKEVGAEDKYIDGGRFALLCFMMNGERIKKTIRMLLRTGPEEAMQRLASMRPSFEDRKRAFFDTSGSMGNLLPPKREY